MDLLEVVAEKRRVFRERREAIDKVSMKAQQDSLAAEKEFKEMKEKTLPKALADFSLGIISKGELAEVRKRFHDLERILTDSPLLLSGLMTERARLDAEGGQFALIEQHIIRPYQALKAEILESGLSSDRIDRLRGFGKELSRELGPEALQDPEEFLKQQGETEPLKKPQPD